MGKRVFIIVMDSFGIGAMPDAVKWGDEGSNTLEAIRFLPEFDCPNLTSLGLFNIDGVSGGVVNPKASYAKMAEASMGKDTTIGHWEIAGLISDKPLPTFPNGFSDDIISEFENKVGRKTLCNKPYSGTEVIKDYGREHIETGALIVYTSADSVFQIAAHEDVVPLDELYRCCEVAREILNKYGVGRVIARPFSGDYPFVRTANRHDYSLVPPAKTMLNLISESGQEVVAVGKINDIFAGSGVTQSYRTKGNNEGLDITIKLADNSFEGLCFVNLVDFDSAYGHRNDAKGYANAATEFDKKLGEFMTRLKKDDVVIITADHGCDPSTPSTDHSREYTPMLIFGDGIKNGVNLGVCSTFADISATVLSYLGVPQNGTAGKSFLSDILK
ncbi:MAG: phosphopentomutase [Clostridiales bacterium]|nr:phosphopentomutase [Clostridiales bacterium]